MNQQCVVNKKSLAEMGRIAETMKLANQQAGGIAETMKLVEPTSHIYPQHTHITQFTLIITAILQVLLYRYIHCKLQQLVAKWRGGKMKLLIKKACNNFPPL